MPGFGFLPFWNKATRPEIAPLFRGKDKEESFDVSSLPRNVQTMELVAKTDIFSEDGSILLISKGATVPLTAVPKLIRNGMRPEYFILRKNGEIAENQEQKAASHGMTNPMKATKKKNMVDQWFSREKTEGGGVVTEYDVPSFHALQDMAEGDGRGDAPRMAPHVVIYDPDEKGMERLTQCLMKAGLHFAKVHPVRTYDHFCWALNKYRPELVFIDFNLGGRGTGRHGFEVLAALSRNPQSVQRIVMTIELAREQEHLREKITASVRALGAEVLFKPLTRFDVQKILDSDDWDGDPIPLQAKNHYA